MSRRFAQISQTKLAEKIEKSQARIGQDFYSWRDLTGQVKKDLEKCDFDFENVSISPNDFGPPELVGYHTLDNGLTFCGVCAGGDWEFPVFFIVYWDGKKLRAYIPVDGNPWNTDTKRAYGNAYSYGYDYSDGENLLKRYPNIFSEITAEECNKEWWRVTFESKKIINDIKQRIKRKI